MIEKKLLHIGNNPSKARHWLTRCGLFQTVNSWWVWAVNVAPKKMLQFIPFPNYLVNWERFGSAAQANIRTPQCVWPKDLENNYSQPMYIQFISLVSKLKKVQMLSLFLCSFSQEFVDNSSIE